MAKKINESKKRKQCYVQFHVIAKAVTGDADAMKSVTAFYEGYIRSFCHRREKNNFGEDSYHFDEVLYQMLKSKLVESVLLKFAL